MYFGKFKSNDTSESLSENVNDQEGNGYWHIQIKIYNQGQVGQYFNCLQDGSLKIEVSAW